MTNHAFLDLCARVFDGKASRDDLRRWNERLVNDPAQRRLYRDLCGHLVLIEEELAGTQRPETARPPRPVVMARSLAAAAAVLVAAWAWWGNRTPAASPVSSDKAVATAEDSAAAPPSAFIYPFDGFPHLEAQAAPGDPDPELRVVALDEVDPRIVTIAQRLAGSGPGDEFDL
jgi:hypothetical protein